MKKALYLSLLVLSSNSALASGIVDMPSENCCPRAAGAAVDHLVLHCVGMSEEWVLHNFGKSGEHGGLGVSAHYYIPPAGDKTIRLVDPKVKAYHAGISEWAGRAAARGFKGLNDFSVGIEVGCEGYGHVGGATLFPYSFQPYREEAILRGIALSQSVMAEYKIPRENVVWHSDISPFRMDKGNVILGKTDPGATFPGKRFAQNGVGVWPVEDREGDEQMPCTFDNFMGLLAKIGFPFKPEDRLESLYAGQAFIMHYAPDEIKWNAYLDQQQGTVWNGEVTENMIVRAHNLVANHYMF